jgi:hypothetical protein
MNKIIFITYATHNERLFDILLESAKNNNINLNVLGYNNKWRGWKKRTASLLNYINNIDDNKLICHIDGFDSIILGGEEELYNKFNKYYKDKKVVFSSDNSNNLSINYYKNKKFGMCHNNFISAGMFIGYNYYVKKILKDFLNSNYSDDQQFFVSICNKDNNIGIDNNILFYNYQYFFNDYKLKYNNKRLIVSPLSGINIDKNEPVIISAPGNVNINSILEKFNYNKPLNYKRNIFSYITKNSNGIIKIFLIEIILLILIIIMIIKIIQ